MKQKILCIVLALVVVIVLNIMLIPSISGASDANYAEALQKSLYFYDAERCGPGVTGGRLEWRGDCHVEDTKIDLATQTNLSSSFISANKSVLDPDGDGCIDLSGGYHDAGDHVKFGLPQSYTASTLAWSYYEFKDAFVDIGEDEHMMDILKGFSDYLLKSTFIDKSGKVIAFNFMVGAGMVDHTYWGPPELQEIEKYERPATFATAENPASDQCGNASAALSIMYLILKDTEKEYAEKCLTTAKALYEFGRTNRGLGNSDGFYGSAYDDDELSWAATWLYAATENMDYINHITSVDSNGLYSGYMKRIINSTSNTWQNIWVHCWDVVWGGTFVELANLFPENEQFKYFSQWNIEYWSGGQVKHADSKDGNYLKLTPAGYGMINTWGSARYNCAAQLCALVLQKYNPELTGFGDWAKSQMDYILGDNPMGYAYEVGYGDAWAVHPHHRAAHGSKINSMLDPPEHRHTLWGALVGGPDAGDKHVDDTTDYVYNEVAIDYNAGFVGALAGHYLLYGDGDKPVANFPPKEPETDDFYCESRVEQENKERTQITLTIHNETSKPPRFEYGLSARYYFNIQEMIDAGQTIDDLETAIYYDEEFSLTKEAVVMNGPIKYDDNGTYYLEFDWSGHRIYGDRELQFALIANQDSSWKSNWDPTNDYSRQNVTTKNAVNERVTVYIDGKIVFGQEPEGGTIVSTSPKPSTTTNVPSTTLVTIPTTSTPRTTVTTTTPTIVTSPPKTTSSSTTSVSIAYNVINDWGAGATVEIKITNNSTKTINGWTLKWDFSGNQKITNSWSADITQSGQTVTAKNAPWSSAIPAGSSVTLGFNISYSGSNVTPTNFIFN